MAQIEAYDVKICLYVRPDTRRLLQGLFRLSCPDICIVDQATDRPEIPGRLTYILVYLLSSLGHHWSDFFSFTSSYVKSFSTFRQDTTVGTVTLTRKVSCVRQGS